MRTGLIAAGNELLKMSRRRSILLVLFGLPLLLIFLLGNGLDMTIKPVRTSVYIGAEGELGKAVQAFIASDAVTGNLVVTLRHSEDAVKEDLRSGTADYGFALPDRFTAQKGEALRYYPGRFAERNLKAESVLDTFAQELNIRLSAAEVPVAAAAAATGQTGQRMDTQAHVKVGTLVSGHITAFGAVSALQYYSAAYLIMFLFFSGASAAISIADEREKGTLLRLYGMPVPLYHIIFGKLAGIAVFAMIQSACIVTVTKFVYGVDWGSQYPLIALICILTSITAICLAAIIISFVRSRKAFESLFFSATVMMTFLSGGMIVEVSPGITKAGIFTVNYWSTDALRRLMNGGTIADITQSLTVLAAIAAVVLLVTALRFRKAVSMK
jgi:ABC-2 type transport system permease protein